MSAAAMLPAPRNPTVLRSLVMSPLSSWARGYRITARRPTGPARLRGAGLGIEGGARMSNPTKHGPLPTRPTRGHAARRRHERRRRQRRGARRAGGLGHRIVYRGAGGRRVAVRSLAGLLVPAP